MMDVSRKFYDNAICPEKVFTFLDITRKNQHRLALTKEVRRCLPLPPAPAPWYPPGNGTRLTTATNPPEART